jgi:chromosome segregation ATPase
MNLQNMIARFERRLERHEKPLNKIMKELERMGKELDDLKTAVGRNTSVIGSAMTLLQGLKSRLDDALANNNTADLQALSQELGTQDQALADAIAANTPAESQPATPPS